MINPHLALCSPHNLDSEGVGLLSPLQPPKSGKEDPGGARLWMGRRAALGPPSTPKAGAAQADNPWTAWPLWLFYSQAAKFPFI